MFDPCPLSSSKQGWVRLNCFLGVQSNRDLEAVDILFLESKRRCPGTNPLSLQPKSLTTAPLIRQMTIVMLQF